ncbi:MAG: signal peptide peptidase SppA [Rickettsiales bacterium]|nr:signal peptide peptidase SppA [Rickettsiales bacterium]
MAVPPETLLDRFRLRRQLNRWRFAVIAIIILFTFLMIGPRDGASPLRIRPHIARVTVDFFIQGQPEEKALFEEVLNNNHTKALLLKLDSGGGTVVGGEVLHDMVQEIAKHIPVVVTMETLATSAAYMVAVPAERIYAHKGTITGSIGVLMEAPNIAGLSDKIGFRMTEIRSGALKGQPSPYEPVSPQVKASLQSVVDDFHDVFVTMVQEGRGLPRDAVEKLADGRAFTGRQALENGLIDAIGGEEEAIKWLEEEKKVKSGLPIYDIEPVWKTPDLWQTMMQDILQTVQNSGAFF